MTVSDVLEKHIEFKKTSVKTEEKRKDIRRYLKRFLDYVNKPMNKIQEEDISKFLNSLEFTTRTINDIKTYIKVFIKWYYTDWSSRFRNLDRICRMQKPSQAYTPEQMINLEEIQKIIAGEKDLMFKVYWSLLFYGGFRPSECCRLEWDNIYFEEEGAVIKIHTTKTNKDFYKSIPKEVEHLLKEWKQYNSSNFLFPSPIKEGSHIQARPVCARLKRLSKRTINKEVVPYALRHSVATILYNDDSRPDDDVANQLGHTKNMKQTYLNLDSNQIKTRARKLWLKTKPMSKDERIEFEQMKKDLEKLKKESSQENKRMYKLIREMMKKQGMKIPKETN